MTAHAEFTPGLTQEIVGIPYVLAAYKGEVPRFVAQPLPPFLSAPSQAVHAHIQALMACRSEQPEVAQDGTMEANGRAWRSLLLAEATLALRGCARRLIRCHNQQRIYGQGPTIVPAARRSFRFVPFADIADEYDEDRLRVASYLQASGYLGNKGASGAHAVPILHDALAFLALYPIAERPGQGEHTRAEISADFDISLARLERLIREQGVRPIVRQTTGRLGYRENDYYAAEDIAALRAAAKIQQRTHIPLSTGTEQSAAIGSGSLQYIAARFSVSMREARRVLLSLPPVLLAQAARDNAKQVNEFNAAPLPIAVQVEISRTIMATQRRIDARRAYTVRHLSLVSGMPLEIVLQHLVEARYVKKERGNVNAVRFSGVKLDAILNFLDNMQDRS